MLVFVVGWLVVVVLLVCRGVSGGGNACWCFVLEVGSLACWCVVVVKVVCGLFWSCFVGVVCRGLCFVPWFVVVLSFVVLLVFGVR